MSSRIELITEMPMKDFEVLGKVGDGAFSVVYKVRRRSDGSEYALKKVLHTNA